MANDIPTYDAAYGIALSSAQSYITSTDPTSYQASVDAATAFATQVDAELFAAGGAGANANRANLMQAICANCIGGRFLLNVGAESAVPASYTAIAKSIAALFIQGKTGLL